ncbi:MAG: plastocyanin/azurin family copper-binding protein [Jhaorihella sp.]
MTLKPIAAALALSLAGLLPAAGAARAETFEIDQVIDLTALTPEEVYRFVPDYLWIEPGDTIEFLNSTGNHTVTAIEGMWPEGAEAVNIEHQPRATVTFERPGIYGFRCKVHGRHGMYALIVVGTPEPNIDRIDYTGVSELGREVFGRLFEKMRQDMTARGD